MRWVVLTVLMISTGCATGGTATRPDPPAPLPEIKYAPPAPGMVWVPGAWSWDATQADYVWVPGHYESPAAQPT